jgi:hypothetical protein
MSVLVNKATRPEVNVTGDVSHWLVKSAQRLVVLMLAIALVLPCVHWANIEVLLPAFSGWEPTF